MTTTKHIMKVIDHEGSNTRLVMLSNGNYIPFNISTHAHQSIDSFAGDVEGVLDAGFGDFIYISDDDPYVGQAVAEGAVVWSNAALAN